MSVRRPGTPLSGRLPPARLDRKLCSLGELLSHGPLAGAGSNVSVGRMSGDDGGSCATVGWITTFSSTAGSALLLRRLCSGVIGRKHGSNGGGG